MTAKTLDTSKPNAEKPLSFNAYQAQNSVAEDQPAPIEDSSVDEQHSSDEYSELDEGILHRRDAIVYSIYKFRHLSTPEIITYLSNTFDCEPKVILTELHALRSKVAFATHKHRVQRKLMTRTLRKDYFKTQCAKAISDAMDSSLPFDCDKIVELSVRYELSPKHIYTEILRNKRLSTQVKRLRDQQRKFTVVRAVLKCAKLNLVY